MPLAAAPEFPAAPWLVPWPAAAPLFAAPAPLFCVVPPPELLLPPKLKKFCAG